MPTQTLTIPYISKIWKKIKYSYQTHTINLLHATNVEGFLGKNYFS
jgi:hypothetical protein